MDPDTLLARKRPDWNALSELFLDTQLSANSLEEIAKVLAETDFPVEELERILFEELYPVHIANLHSTAGEWLGFDLQSLEKAILANAGKPRKCFAGWQWSRWMVASDWKTIRVLVDESRQHAPRTE